MFSCDLDSVKIATALAGYLTWSRTVAQPGLSPGVMPTNSRFSDSLSLLKICIELSANLHKHMEFIMNYSLPTENPKKPSVIFSLVDLIKKFHCAFSKVVRLYEAEPSHWHTGSSPAVH